MSEFLPKEVREGLEAARKNSLKKRARLRVRVGEQDGAARGGAAP